MNFERIDDPGDPRLADYVGLSDPQIRRRQEVDRFFIAEGIEVVKRLISSDVRCRSIVVAPNRLDAMKEDLRHVRCPVYVADRKVVSQIAGFDLHRGVIAAGDRPESARLDDIFSQRPRHGERHRIALLHGISDHENLGAIVRSARAFHIDALVLDSTCADPYYRRSVRVSMGEIFFLPVVHMSTLAAIESVRAHGGTSIALTPKRDAISIDEVAVTGDAVATVFGSEGFGLPDEVLSAADVCSRIPIADDVDSLNVGHAAAIAFARVASL